MQNCPVSVPGAEKPSRRISYLISEERQNSGEDDKSGIGKEITEILQLEIGPQSYITQDGNEEEPQYSVNCSDWLILKTMDCQDANLIESSIGSPQWRITDNTTICLQEIDIKLEILDEDPVHGTNSTAPQHNSQMKTQNDKKVRNKTKTQSNPSHPCDVCPRVFVYKSSLTSHQRLHTGEHLFLCEKCPKKFVKRTLLELHVRSHTGEKPYSCQHCTVKFSNKSSQQIHLRIHTGEKPHACNTCSKRFSRKTQLTEHVRIHTGDQPFLCDTCPKKFSSKVNLTVHQRVHTGDRPYSCAHCPKDFVQRTNLSTHMLIHTTARSFSCDHCSSKFKRKQHLTRHLFTHTGHPELK